MQVVIINNVPLFFQERDGPWCPTLRVLHQYPDMMKKLRADKGAIKFVVSGANIMCPGLTSPGATIHDEVGWGGVERALASTGAPVCLRRQLLHFSVTCGIQRRMARLL